MQEMIVPGQPECVLLPLVPESIDQDSGYSYCQNNTRYDQPHFHGCPRSILPTYIIAGKGFF
jgi:hypothetical protein